MSGNGTPRDNGTPKKKEAFLKALLDRGSVTHACHDARIGRTTAYRWRADDEDFAQEWQNTVDEAVEELEAALYERGKGWNEPVFNKDGHQSGERFFYDTTAAIFWLKGHAPEKYRERHDMKGEMKLSFHEALAMLRPERREALQRN